MTDFFSDKPYPGRFLIVGLNSGQAVVMYGATGRSPSSLARRFVEQGDGIYMAAVDATVAIKGNPDLLEYPAVKFFDNGMLAANGNHIDLVESPGTSGGALESLSLAFSDRVTYEPDEYRTPRITACMLETNKGFDAALHLVRSNPANEPAVSYWQVPLEEGKGMYIATYTGADVRPTPSFSSAPLPVNLRYASAPSAARGVYEALAPRAGSNDYRIGVVAAYKAPGKEPEFSIINTIA